MAEGRSTGRQRPHFNDPEPQVSAETIAALKARTVAEAEAIYCVCHHTEGAHKAGGATRPCAFCRCQNFQAQSIFAGQEDEAPLSPAAQRGLQILSETEAFKSVPAKGLRALAQHSQRRLFLSGQRLMGQGDESQSLHVIVKGHVSVERQVPGSQPIVLADLGPSEVVGEMGVLDGSPRSATVIATSDLETVELTAEVMKQTFREFPQALMAVLKMVTERMRNTDALVEKTVEIALNQLEGGEQTA